MSKIIRKVVKLLLHLPSELLQHSVPNRLLVLLVLSPGTMLHLPAPMLSVPIHSTRAISSKQVPLAPLAPLLKTPAAHLVLVHLGRQRNHNSKARSEVRSGSQHNPPRRGLVVLVHLVNRAHLQL